MKKEIRRSLLMAGLGFSLLLGAAGCGEGTPVEEENKEAVDIDLTGLSTTMAYSQACQMTQEPEDYDGKRVRVHGVYNSFLDADTEEAYFYCQVPDSTGCCMAAFEFETAEELSYPEEYPEEFDEITIVGDFVTFDDDGYLGCMVKNAILEDIPS